MPYFFSDKELKLNQTSEIAGPEARHVLLSHRVKVGEKIKVQGPDRKRYLVDVVDIDRNSLKVKPIELISVPEEPAIKITLFQSIVSEKALDFIFQKGTELGLSKIVLFNSKNTAVRLSNDQFKKKHDRWNKILIEAAKQCERAVWPELEFVSDVDQILEKLKDFDKVFLTDIGGSKPLALNPTPLALALIVGPEGGLTSDEVNSFKSLSNVQSVSFGPLVLRAETAALAAIAILSQI